MPNKLSVKSLLSNFPPSTSEQWKAIATEETQFNTIDQLAWKGTNELVLLPYYDKRDHHYLETRNSFDLRPSLQNKKGRQWSNLAPVVVEKEKTANREALQHLENGAEGILFECAHELNFNMLLSEIQLNFCRVHFVFSDTAQAKELFDYINEQYSALHEIYGGILWKKYPENSESVFSDFEPLKNFLSLGNWVDGSEPVEEIVSALLNGVQLADHLTDKNHHCKSVLSSIFFSLESGSDFFFTIAKLKALRLLWYQVLGAYNINESYQDIHLHARCPPYVNEKYEPHSNLLKSTIASLAASIGGCDSLSVYAQERSNTMLSRVARNVSTILKEESHTDAVADPLAGSYYVDTLINALAQKAWKKFQDIISR
jgi:methylmalonyl-CoA mutase